MQCYQAPQVIDENFDPTDLEVWGFKNFMHVTTLYPDRWQLAIFFQEQKFSA